MSEHSRLSPSSMARILKCPASAVHNPLDTGSAAAAEGTFAHTLCEQMLSGKEVDFPNDEMESAVFEYVAYVKDHKSHDELDGVNHSNSEISLESRIVSKDIPDHGGTIDTLIVSDTHIHVIDFKYGTMPVASEDNKQLLSYLVLACEKFPGRTRFFGTIIQPRVYGRPRCVEYTRAQLDEHLFAVMMADIDDSKEAGDHCRWCPLKQDCEVLEQHVKDVATMVFDDGWDGEKCKTVIAMGGVISTLVVDAKHQLTKLLKDGAKVDGWKLVRQLANRCWIDDDMAIMLLESKGLDDTVIYNQKIKSPAQLEKFSKAYKPFVSANAHRPEKGIIDVESSNKLPEYDPASEFTDIEV